jgi:hypothetical protein
LGLRLPLQSEGLHVDAAAIASRQSEGVTGLTVMGQAAVIPSYSVHDRNQLAPEASRVILDA